MIVNSLKKHILHTSVTCGKAKLNLQIEKVLMLRTDGIKWQVRNYYYKTLSVFQIRIAAAGKFAYIKAFMIF